MKRIKREITREQFVNFMKNHDCSDIFTDQELMGYGVYNKRVYEQDGKYYVDFMLGDCCD